MPGLQCVSTPAPVLSGLISCGSYLGIRVRITTTPFPVQGALIERIIVVVSPCKAGEVWCEDSNGNPQNAKCVSSLMGCDVERRIKETIPATVAVSCLWYTLV